MISNHFALNYEKWDLYQPCTAFFDKEKPQFIDLGCVVSFEEKVRRSLSLIVFLVLFKCREQAQRLNGMPEVLGEMDRRMDNGGYKRLEPMANTATSRSPGI